MAAERLDMSTERVIIESLELIVTADILLLVLPADCFACLLLVVPWRIYYTGTGIL
jgi:hypothetical protein